MSSVCYRVSQHLFREKLLTALAFINKYELLLLLRIQKKGIK